MNEVIFDKETHTYILDGYVLPSVNQVFDCIGHRKNRDDYLNSVSGCEFMGPYEEAKQFGSDMHALIAAIERGKKVSYNDEIKPYVESYKGFYKEYPYMKTYDNCIEKSMGSVELGFAGTTDKIAINKIGQHAIVDWKTSKSKNKIWILQLAAYAKLFSTTYLNGELKGIDAFSVRIRDKKPLVDFYDTEELELAWEKFNHMLQIYLDYYPLKEVENVEKKK